MHPHCVAHFRVIRDAVSENPKIAPHIVLAFVDLDVTHIRYYNGTGDNVCIRFRAIEVPLSSARIITTTRLHINVFMRRNHMYR